MKTQDEKELVEQSRRSHNAPSRDFEEVCKELGIPPLDDIEEK